MPALEAKLPVISTFGSRNLNFQITHQSNERKENALKSRGNLTAHRLFGINDLRFGNPEPHVDRVIKAFLAIGEAVAARWIQMPKAILLLQMAPDNPASGAIYIYDRLRQEFYMLSFEGPEDTITRDEFTCLLHEYNLLRYAEQPGLLRQEVHSAMAA